MTYDPKTWVDGECLEAADLNAMEAGIDRAQGDVMRLYGPTAGLPVSDPLLVGRLYFESDLLQRIWRDNGAGWDDVTPFAGNGLLNNLIAYWPGNEVAGNALDLHVNALHLTDVNTVTSNPGLVYPLARQYTAANLEYHTRPGDDALLSTGDLDFTLASWCRFDNLAAAATVSGKYSLAANREYILYYNAPTNRLRFYVSTNGVATFFTQADTLGAPVINTWYLIIGWHDSVANTINIQVNDGGVDSVPHAAGVFDSATPLEIGRYTAGGYMNGRANPTMFWKSAAGAGGVLTAAQRTALWNGGAGLTYAAFTV